MNKGIFVCVSSKLNNLSLYIVTPVASKSAAFMQMALYLSGLHSCHNIAWYEL